jgi:hypothetical protein
MDLDLTMTKPFPAANSKSIKIKVTQKSTSKNFGWEGWLSVKGVKGDDSEVKLLDKTKEFKLGENTNPKDATFSFE